MPSSQFYVCVQTTFVSPDLRVRSQPTTASDTLTFEEPVVQLLVLEEEATAKPKIGVSNQWLRA
jgi:hypothetical protein